MFKNLKHELGERLRRGAGKLKKARKKIGRFFSKTFRRLILVTVNPKLALENIPELNHVHPDITRNLPSLMEGSQVSEEPTPFKIFPWNEDFDAITKRVQKKGYRWAKFYELPSFILFAMRFPRKIPRRFRGKSPVTLGSSYEDSGKQMVVVFTGNDRDRVLAPMDIKTQWAKHFCFLAVYVGKPPRKTKTPPT